MTTFPDTIRILITDSIFNQPIENILLHLIIYANRKNNYGMFPNLSNNKGIIIIEKSWIIDEINDSRNTYIMDYSSTIEDCKSIIGIEVLSEEAIININKIRNKYGLYKPIEGTTNHLYKSKMITIDISLYNKEINYNIILERN
jgi:hypothetical protein